MDKIIKEITEILNRVSKLLPASEVDKLEEKLLDGAWKKMFKDIECDFIVLKDNVKNRAVNP
jgi:hypothetical protein